MWPFLLGLVGWTALLLWGWIQVGRSLGGPVRGTATVEQQPMAGASPDGAGERDPDDVTTTVPHD
ncbi:MAG: hypothetical protein ABEL04_13730 [Salinibacter sp.]|uniref:hypothetical protein n=1 Tax=Salinibacter sp. TaxID=2065818 RepID=UPI0035D492F2